MKPRFGNHSRAALGVSFALLTGSVDASSVFDCEIRAKSITRPDGALGTLPVQEDDRRFSVNRVTGEIHGGPLATVGLIRGFVLDLGNSQSRFKLYTLEPSPNGTRYVRFISIDTSDVPDKPFLAVDAGVVLSGVCRLR